MILAIIALIATPIVLNIIKEAKKSSTEASMKMIERAAEIYYYDNSISEKREEITFICDNGKCSSEDKVLKLEGATPKFGIIKIDKNGKVTLKSILMNGYNCSKNNGSYKCEKANKRRIKTEENMLHINDNKLIHVTDYRIYGKNVEENESEQIREVGDLVTDTTSEHYGKYEIKIKVISKNILDKNQSVESAIKNETSVCGWGDTIFDNDWIINNLKQNTKYTISYDVECTSVPEYDTQFANNFGFYLFSSNDEAKQISLMAREYLNVGDKKHILVPFTTPSNILDSKLDYEILTYTNRYLKDNIGVFGSMIFSNIQLELGEQATEYEPYKEEIYSIYLEEPLGDNEYIDFKTGMVVRNEIQEEIQLPEIYLNEDITNIIIDTEIKPFKIELEYYN